MSVSLRLLRTAAGAELVRSSLVSAACSRCVDLPHSGGDNSRTGNRRRQRGARQG